jgi:FtsH-binding integral membrane protein
MDKNKTDPIVTHESHVFDEASIAQPKRGSWKVMLPVLILLFIGMYIVYRYQFNPKAAAVGVVLVGLYTGLVAWLLGVITLVPFIGPILVKVLTMSFIWVLNAVGYFVSYVAIKRGYSKDVIAYRGLTIALLVGIVIGYVVAQYI